MLLINARNIANGDDDTLGLGDFSVLFYLYTRVFDVFILLASLCVFIHVRGKWRIDDIKNVFLLFLLAVYKWCFFFVRYRVIFWPARTLFDTEFGCLHAYESALKLAKRKKQLFSFICAKVFHERLLCNMINSIFV